MSLGTVHEDDIGWGKQEKKWYKKVEIKKISIYGPKKENSKLGK